MLIEGRLKLDTWETNDGQKRSKLHVVGEKMQMLGGRPSGGGGGQSSGPHNNAAAVKSAPAQGPPPDDEVPF